MERWKLSEADMDELPVTVREDMLLVMEGEREAEDTANRASKNKRGR